MPGPAGIKTLLRFAEALARTLADAGFPVDADDIPPGVTEADVVIFAGLSGDYNVLHTDAEHMKASIFGERIAHGLLGLAISSGLGTRAMAKPYATLAFLGLRWRFKGPIKIGDTIKVRLTVKQKTAKETPEGGVPQGVVAWDVEVTNQHGELVASYDILTLVAKRG